MKKEKMYSIAIRKRESSSDFFWDHNDFCFVECKIDCQDRYWVADPFLFEKDGIVYIFYEAYDLVKKRGCIGYSIYEDSANVLKVNIIISESYHLSFPNIFTCNNEIYIMPESCENYSLHVYKAISFPDKWERDKDILPDVFACDSIFIKDKERKYLLTNEMYHNAPHGKVSSCWVKNYLYEISGINVCNYEGVKIAEGDFGIRNAGKIIEINDTLYRVGQDCRNSQYGCGLVFFKITGLSPYNEILFKTWSISDFLTHIKYSHANEIIGLHTYNYCNHYEIIDISRMKEICKETWILRKISYLSHVLLRILNKVIQLFNN